MDGVKGHWRLVAAGVIVAVVVGGLAVGQIRSQGSPSISCSDKEIGTELSIPRQECDVLAELFNRNNRTTIGDDFADWPDESNPCLWKAVTCRNGHVNAIRIVGHEYGGFVIPSSIVALTELESLHLSMCDLAVVPPEIGDLQALKYLGFSWNAELSELPPEIGRLSELESLNLVASGLTGLPDEVFQLKRLTVLDASFNSLPDFPKDVVRLRQLRSLDLSSNSFSLRDAPETLVPLTELDQLNTLKLWGTGLRELPPEIGRLHNLTTLELGDNHLKGLPPEFAQLTKLNTLGLHANDLTALPDELGSLGQLRSLDLSGNAFHGADLAALGGLTELNNLDLSSNEIEDLPPEIAALTKLADLDLSSNGLDSVPPVLLEINPSSLDLSYNRLTDFSVPVGDLTNLAELDLSDNAFTEFPVDVIRLSNLEWLRLGSNEIQVVPAEIGEMEGLERLDLSINAIGGDVTDWLGPLVVRADSRGGPPIVELDRNNCLSSTDPKVVAYLEELVDVLICGSG